MSAFLVLTGYSSGFHAPLGAAAWDHARSARPSMAGKTEVFNPVKIIATVIAQAEIVGVQAPFSPDVAPLAPSISRLPNDARREVDRDCVHPLLKLGNGDTIEPALTAALKSPLLLALAAPFAAVLAPCVPAVVAARKVSWAAEVQASAAEHRAAFDASWQSYRHRQSELVDELLAAAGIRDPLLPPSEAPFTVCVTMATGQEGTAVVKALSHLGSGAVPTTLPNLIVRALVRNPESAKAKELAKLPRVEVVQADSVDESSLAAALDGADAAYLCTTLNNANAGRWSMGWVAASTRWSRVSRLRRRRPRWTRLSRSSTARHRCVSGPRPTASSRPFTTRPSGNARRS